MDIQPHSTPERIESSIDEVTDSQGEPVPPNSTTEDTVLTLTGSGTASSIVFIFDNDELLTPASVTINRTWNFTETVALGRHVFTVRDSLGGVDSPEWVVTVGEAELDLDPPTITQAPSGILNPMNAINGATVVVTYAMQTTDTIGISWNGLDNLVPTQPGSTLGSVTFTIPASAVAPVIGKTIEVLYGVVRNGVPKPSEVLDLTVQALPDAELEAPRILQATDGGSLDIRDLTGDADLKVKPWPFIDAGQLISLRFEGTKLDGSPYNWSHPTWQNLPISSTGEPSTTVALSHLKELKDASNLTLVFEVSFDGGLTKVLFPARTLSVIRGASGFEDFETLLPGAVPGGIGLNPPSGLKIISLNTGVPASIVRAASQQGEHGFQYVSLSSIVNGYSHLYAYPPGRTFRTIRFTLWAATYSQQLTCYYGIGSDSESFEARTIIIPFEERVTIEYTAPPGKFITVISARKRNFNEHFSVLAFDSLYWSE